MEILIKVMYLYGITLLISMGVATIIWGLSKLINFLPKETAKPK
jgi:hypothetical protein